MAIRVVQLGTPRDKAEGLRIGTVRRPPRGVPKAEFARRDYYDAWLPELAPSSDLVTWALSQPWTSARWTTYSRKYLRQMREPSAQRLIGLLASLSHTTDFSIGCYCEDELRCHRSLLRGLLADHGAAFA
jgi:uncharacterized protein YeaO (DUF488 family)